MRPNASVKMRPVCNCFCCATWIATCNRDCQEPARSRQNAGASCGSSITLPLFATRSEALSGFGFSPPARLIRCIGIQNNPPKSQVCHAICRYWKTKTNSRAIGTHSRFTRQNRSYAERPTEASKTFIPAIPRELADLDRRTPRCTTRLRGPLPNRSSPCRMAVKGLPKLAPLRGVELKAPVCICCGCILFRIEY
jgi:hypothetical protein